MQGFADANLVLAAGDPEDALHQRAITHIGRVERLRVPFAVGVELLLVGRKKDKSCVDIVTQAARSFDVDGLDALMVAAESLDLKDVSTPFDAVHLAVAFVHGVPLHTADRRLHKTPFPTVAW